MPGQDIFEHADIPFYTTELRSMGTEMLQLQESFHGALFESKGATCTFHVYVCQGLNMEMFFGNKL